MSSPFDTPFQPPSRPGVPAAQPVGDKPDWKAAVKWAGLALRERPGKWFWLLFVIALLLFLPWDFNVLLSNLTDQEEGWPEQLGLVIALLDLVLLLPMISLAVVRLHESAAKQLNRDGLIVRVPKSSRVTGYGWLLTFSVSIVLAVALIPVLTPGLARRTFCAVHPWSRDMPSRCGEQLAFAVEPKDQFIAMVIVSLLVPLVGYLVYVGLVADGNLKEIGVNALQLGAKNYRWTVVTQVLVFIVTAVCFLVHRGLWWAEISAENNLLSHLDRGSLGSDFTMFLTGTIAYPIIFAVGLGIPILFAALIWAHLSYQAGIFDRFRGPSSQAPAGSPLQNLGYQRQAPNGYRSSPFG